MGYMKHVPSILSSKTPGAPALLNYSKRVIYGSIYMVLSIPKCIETEPMYLAMSVS